MTPSEEQVKATVPFVCADTFAISTETFGGLCPVHRGDACLVRVDFLLALRESAAVQAERERCARVVEGEGPEMCIHNAHYAAAIRKEPQ